MHVSLPPTIRLGNCTKVLPQTLDPGSGSGDAGQQTQGCPLSPLHRLSLVTAPF